MNILNLFRLDINATNLQERMTAKIKKYNKKCHPYKAHIITIKSKNILKQLNGVTHLNNKVDAFVLHNEILKEVANKIISTFNPTFIYTFNDEIHVVFNYNEEGYFLYDCDISKTMTKIVSLASTEFSKQLWHRKLDVNVMFHGKFVEFDKEYECMNYIIWRQLDCKRNNITLLSKCKTNASVKGVSLIKLELELEEEKEKMLKWNEIVYGMVVKRGYINNKAVIKIDSKELANNFIENMREYLQTNYKRK